MLTVDYVPSTSHWIFPPIILCILGILMVIMIIERFVKCKKEHKPFINSKNYRFFEKNFDSLRLFGTPMLFLLYIFSMIYFGFLFSSIVFIFAFNVLFCGIEKIKAVPAALKIGKFWTDSNVRSCVWSLIISVVSSVFIWYIFSQVFFITLP